MDPSVILGMMGAAITAMFGWIVKNQNDRLIEKDQQARDWKADFERQIGDLRADFERNVEKIESERDQLSTELKSTVIAAKETVLAQQEGTRQELAELRKTNALLVANLSGKESAS